MTQLDQLAADAAPRPPRVPIPDYTGLQLLAGLLKVMAFAVTIVGGAWGLQFAQNFPLFAFMVAVGATAAGLVLLIIASAASAFRDIARNSWYLRQIH